MKIHVGDIVVVTTGRDKGKTGKVLRHLQKNNTIQVEGINKRLRHVKSRGEQTGGRLDFFAPLPISNVAIIDPSTNKPTRIGYQIAADGAKQRIARPSGTILPDISKEKKLDSTKSKNNSKVETIKA